MNIVWVYGILPLFVIEDNNIPPKDIAVTNGIVIRMRTEVFMQKGYLAHECSHGKRNYRRLFILPYNKLEGEIAAYKAQMAADPLFTIDDAVLDLTSDAYTFNLTAEEARYLLEH